MGKRNAELTNDGYPSKMMLQRKSEKIKSLCRCYLMVVCILFPFGLSVRGQQLTDRSSSVTDVHQWVKRHFARGKLPPFSFVYGGKSSDSFISSWKFSNEMIKSTDLNATESVYTYSDKQSGLVVQCFVTLFNDFRAVEWVLKFSNSSENNTPLIEKVAAIDYSFVAREKGSFTLHHAKGSNAERSDFQPVDDKMQIGKSIYLTPNGGRSSDNTAFPFFNIEIPGQQGIVVALGWTGKWYADVLQANEKTVSLKSGMEKMRLVLYPKEEIRTPRICLLFWKGEDRMVGHNQFRQFVLIHHTRKINVKHVDLPFSTFLAREGPPPCNEHTCATESFTVAMINRHQQFKIVPEVFWLDAGWYACNGSWWKVGNWTPNSENFPNGLKPVTDAAHKAGAKFDPEKNKWINHQYLVKQNDTDLAKAFAPIVTEKGIYVAENVLTRIVSLIKERANFVSEFWDLSDFFFVAPTSYDEKARKNWKEETPALMQELISVLSEITDFTSLNIETIVKDWMTKNEIGMGKVMQPFRLSLVGALKGPHLFDIVELIGKEETIKRIEKAIATL